MSSFYYRGEYGGGEDYGIYIIKLIGGVTLLSYAEPLDEDGESFRVSHPFELIKSLNETNVSVGYFPWLFGSEENQSVIHSMDIITMIEASHDMINTYRELIGVTSDNNNKPLTGLDNLDFPFNDPWKNRMN